jgi:hypothetical protein
MESVNEETILCWAGPPKEHFLVRDLHGNTHVDRETNMYFLVTCNEVFSNFQILDVAKRLKR